MKKVILFILLFVFWLALTFDLTLPNVLTGISAALLTTLIFGKYFIGGAGKFLDLKRYFWFVIYVVVLIWECLKANLDVAYRVLHPKLPVKPGIVKVKLNLKSELGRAMLANSITMTPGTISVDIHDDHLFVHWIYVSTKNIDDYSGKITGRFEQYIKKIFE